MRDQHHLLHMIMFWYDGYGYNTGAGSFLHIATDDGNLEDCHLTFCIESGKEWRKNFENGILDDLYPNQQTLAFFEFGISIAEKFFEFDLDVRKSIYNRFWDIYYGRISYDHLR